MAYKSKEDQRAYAREHYLRNKATYIQRAKVSAAQRRQEVIEYVDSLKSVPCLDCGNSFPTVCMDFDHLPEFEKEFNITDGIRKGYSIERLRIEIAKCEVVCSNCHRIRTANRRA